MIESLSNVKIKQIQKLIKQSRTRRKERAFVVEGWKMASEALIRNLVLHLYITESEKNSYEEHLKRLGCDFDGKKGRVEIVADSVFRQISDTVTPQGILAIVQMPEYSRKQVVAGNAGGIYDTAKLLVLEDIQDPGNMGTILRTAEGAGMSGIVLTKGCVDLFNPKVVRSTMGALFRVPFYICEDLVQEIEMLKQQGFSFYAAHLQGEMDYSQPSYEGKLGILIGNEANGLRDAVAELADVKVKIPMEGELESLNAAVSAALFVYEVHRHNEKQRE